MIPRLLNNAFVCRFHTSSVVLWQSYTPGSLPSLDFGRMVPFRYSVH